MASEVAHGPGYRPAREAFAMGRMMVIPSRAESLPYVILEAAAAGVPIISTRVGGIPEIFGPQSDQLIAPDDIGALIGAISSALDNPAGLRRVAQMLQARVQAEFSLPAMVDGGLAAYREALVKTRAIRITKFFPLFTNLPARARKPFKAR
jgi:glycosyltransferase involved in cell wall biosynthesis